MAANEKFSLKNYKFRWWHVIVAGVAVVGGVYLSGKFRPGGGSAAEPAQNVYAPNINPVVGNIQDDYRMDALAKRILELEQQPSPSERYPPMPAPSTPAPSTPAPSTPAPSTPAEIESTLTGSPQNLTLTWKARTAGVIIRYKRHTDTAVTQLDNLPQSGTIQIAGALPATGGTFYYNIRDTKGVREWYVYVKGTAAAAQPSIISLDIVPSGTVRQGEQIAIVWKTANAARATLEGGSLSQAPFNVAVNGEHRGTPARGTWTWTLKVYDSAGVVRAQRSITKTIAEAPRSDATPPIPAPPTNSNVPGGYPETSEGVSARPPDHPGRDVVAWIKSSNNPSHRAGKALAWAVAGQQGGIAGTPSKLGPMNEFINNPANWPKINASRRARGLRALNNQSFAALAARIKAEYKGRDDFSDQFIRELWETYHLPYLA
jgi:hypothetical protein